MSDAPTETSRRQALLHVLRSSPHAWIDTRRIAREALALLDDDTITETLVTVLARDARRIIRELARGNLAHPADNEILVVAGTDRVMMTTTETERVVAADRLARLATGLTNEAGKLREYLPPVTPTPPRNPVIEADELAAARDNRQRHINRQRALAAQKRARRAQHWTPETYRLRKHRTHLAHIRDALLRQNRKRRLVPPG